MQTICGFVAVSGRLTIPTAVGKLVYENISSESLFGYFSILPWRSLRLSVYDSAVRLQVLN